MSDYVKEYKKGSNEILSKNFGLFEFDCRCDKCYRTLVDSRLIDLLEKLRAELRMPVLVTSGYRCVNRQSYLRWLGFETAKQVSAHELGKAVDIVVRGLSGVEIAQSADRVGFPSIGQALLWCHLDVRGLDDGKIRKWNYSG